MTAPHVPPAPRPRWLSKPENRRLVGRAICAALFTGLLVAMIPWSMRLTQGQQMGGLPGSGTPTENMNSIIRMSQIAVVFAGAFWFTMYEVGGFVLGLLVGMIDDSFAGRRTQPRAAVRDDSDL